LSPFTHYQKYHFCTRIDILRVKCGLCGKTHALIPIFSVPQMSLGMKETEAYLIARAQGASRSVAARPLTEQGWEIRVGKRLERRLQMAVNRAKAIWPDKADPALAPLAWIEAVCGPSETPLVAMNAFALAHRINAICFCRFSILFFGPPDSPPESVHNLESTQAGSPLVGLPAEPIQEDSS